jgi:glucan phosphoethanolaminetransferase (alkaline phosphatase superfamily)
VPTSLPPEPTDNPPPSVMPASVRVAAITMGVLAALLLTSAGLLWYGFDDAVDGVVQKGADISRGEAERIVMLSLVPSLVVGVLLALAAWFLPRRQPWARWIGLAGATLLGLMSLLVTLASGAISAYTLLVFVLSAAAVTSLLARTTGTWVPRLRTRA